MLGTVLVKLAGAEEAAVNLDQIEYVRQYVYTDEAKAAGTTPSVSIVMKSGDILHCNGTVDEFIVTCNLFARIVAPSLLAMGGARHENVLIDMAQNLDDPEHPDPDRLGGMFDYAEVPRPPQLFPTEEEK